MPLAQQLHAFVSDCEGPITKNDNAFEIASHFLPKGDYFFTLISRYDDVLADIVKRPGYRAGYTLKLITPFFKAYDLTNKKIKAYSANNIILIRGVKEMLHRVKEVMPTFIVSTSYEQYLLSLCSILRFPCENVYCTPIDLDKYSINRAEKKQLKRLQREISALPMIEIPDNAKSINQFSERNIKTITRLDNIFWEEIPIMDIGKMLEEIKPIGGEEKAESVIDIKERVGCDLSNVVYFGDSITDVQAFKLVRKGGGLTVSFNGNDYAVKNAEVAVLSNNAVVTTILALVFSEYGRNGVLKLVENWGYLALNNFCSDKTLLKSLSKAYPTALPKVEQVTKNSVDRLIKESSSFRKTVRGEAIGRLG